MLHRRRCRHAQPGAVGSHLFHLRALLIPAGMVVIVLAMEGRGERVISAAPLPQRIFFPNAEEISSTARSAVRLCSSITGLTSTTSKLSMRPWSAMISIAR